MDALVSALLISMLGSPHFATRQAASASLEQLGDRALPALLASVADSDPEVRQRVGRLIEARRPAIVDRLAARHPELRVDALPLNYPNRWWVVGDYLACVAWPDYSSEEGESDGPPSAPYRNAVRFLIVDLLYNGTSYADVSRLLDRMAERQAKEWNGDYWLDEVD